MNHHRVREVARFFLSLAGLRVHDDPGQEALRKAGLAVERFPGVTLDELTEAFEIVSVIYEARGRRIQELHSRLESLRSCALANPAAIRQLEAELSLVLNVPVAEGGVSPLEQVRRSEAGAEE